MFKIYEILTLMKYINKFLLKENISFEVTCFGTSSVVGNGQRNYEADISFISIFIQILNVKKEFAFKDETGFRSGLFPFIVNTK